MPYVLGIDFDDEYARAVLMRSRLGRSECIRVMEVPIPARSDEEDAPLPKSESLREILESCPRPPDSIVGHISGTSASLRAVDLPAVAAKKASAILPFELEALVPFALEETIVAHQPISRTDNQLRLLAAAVPEAQLVSELEHYTGAGVNPQQMAVGAAALDTLTAYLPADAGSTSLIIEIRATQTDLCLLHQGRCVLARTFSAGAKELSVDATGFRGEVQRTLLGHLSQGGEEPTSVFVAGASAESDDFVNWLAELLDRPVQPLALPQPTETSAPAEARFARAFALAARITARGNHINVLIGEYAPRRASGFLRSQAKLISACTISILFALSFALYGEYQSVRTEQERLEQRLESVTASLLGTGTRDPELARELLIGGQSLNDPLPRFTAFDGLAAIAQLIPEGEGHRLRSLEIEIGDSSDEGEITLKGALGEGGSAALSSIEEGLRSQECFRDIVPATTRSGGQGKTNYELRAVLRCPWQDGADSEGSEGRNGS